MRLVAEPLRLIAYETAAALGPEWRVEGLLSTAMVVHPIGIRFALDDGTDALQITAHVSVSRNRNRPLETVTATVEMSNDRAVSVRRTVQAIRTKILPHFGREDAVAGLRVLALPLRDAGISGIARGTSDQTIIEYRPEGLSTTIAEYEEGERRPLGVIITALRGDDSTRVEIRIPHLPLREAARITEGLRPGLGTRFWGIENLPEEVRDQVAATFPGLTAQHVVTDVPRCTDLTDDSGVLTIRHFLAVKPVDGLNHPRTWAAVWLRDASVAQAYAVLSAYASA